MPKIYEQINENTWCQGAFESTSSTGITQHCASGWLIAAGYGISGEAYKLVQQAAGINYTLCAWNDETKRTWQDVRDAFKKANL